MDCQRILFEILMDTLIESNYDREGESEGGRHMCKYRHCRAKEKKERRRMDSKGANGREANLICQLALLQRWTRG